jgi:hypothetical protein
MHCCGVFEIVVPTNPARPLGSFALDFIKFELVDIAGDDAAVVDLP